MPCTRPASSNPGTMAAVLGLDDDQVEVACRRADSDVWVANFNAPGQVVIAGSPDGVAAGRRSVPRSSAPRRSCRCRCRGAFHTPFMAPARDRLRKAIAEANATRHRGAGRLQRRRPRPRPRRRVGQPAVGPAVAARCAGSTACSRWPTPASPSFVELGPGRCAHRHGQAHRHRRAGPSRWRRPTISTSCSSGSTPAPATPSRAAIEGEHLFATERLVVSPAAGVFTPIRRRSATARASRSATVLGTSATPRCARRSPACCRATSPSTANGSPCRQPIAWLRTV